MNYLVQAWTAIQNNPRAIVKIAIFNFITLLAGSILSFFASLVLSDWADAIWGIFKNAMLLYFELVTTGYLVKRLVFEGEPLGIGAVFSESLKYFGKVWTKGFLSVLFWQEGVPVLISILAFALWGMVPEAVRNEIFMLIGNGANIYLFSGMGTEALSIFAEYWRASRYIAALPISLAYFLSVYFSIMIINICGLIVVSKVVYKTKIKRLLRSAFCLSAPLPLAWSAYLLVCITLSGIWLKSDSIQYEMTPFFLAIMILGIVLGAVIVIGFSILYLYMAAVSINVISSAKIKQPDVVSEQTERPTAPLPVTEDRSVYLIDMEPSLKDGSEMQEEKLPPLPIE